MKLSDIFAVAKRTKRVLSGSVYHVYIRLISYSDFTCATDDFKKYRENAIFENCVKIYRLKNSNVFVFFKMARLVCFRLYFELIIFFYSKTICLQKRCFLHFKQKNEEVNEKYSKITTKLLSV